MIIAENRRKGQGDIRDGWSAGEKETALTSGAVGDIVGLPVFESEGEVR